MQDYYKTLAKPAEGMFRDRNSRFLAFGFPVNSILQVNDHLAYLKKKYHDARHHCYAYCIGADKSVYRINDDGEPSGTAGKPIYGQIQSNELTDILIVVVRYFGGILLGTSGLINAYRSATMNLFSHCEFVFKYIEAHYQIKFPYEKTSAVFKLLREENLVPLEPVYDTQCLIKVAIRKSHADQFIKKISGIDGIIYEILVSED